MITYQYHCDSCGLDVEIDQSIKDDPVPVCVECRSTTFHRVPCTPLYVKVVGEPTTIGQLAERNSRGMSSDQKRVIQEENRTKKTINRIPSHLRPTSIPDTTDNTKLPDWVEKPRTKTHKEIGKMSERQKQKYIFEG
jgi:putative FmdB family regulatory protein